MLESKLNVPIKLTEEIRRNHQCYGTFNNICKTTAANLCAWNSLMLAFLSLFFTCSSNIFPFDSFSHNIIDFANKTQTPWRSTSIRQHHQAVPKNEFHFKCILTIFLSTEAHLCHAHYHAMIDPRYFFRIYSSIHKFSVNSQYNNSQDWCAQQNNNFKF